VTRTLALLDAVRDALPREGVVVADMTMLGYASAEYLPVYEPRTYIHPSELCTIGCALPLALGAKAVLTGRPVAWGVSAFGPRGVERVFAILSEEMKRVLCMTGVASVALWRRA